MGPFAVNAITSFSYFPLQIATYLGFLIAGISLLAIIAVIILRLMTPGGQLLGQATTLVAVLFWAVYSLFHWDYREYLSRIYDEVKQRPLYLVQQKWDDET